MFYNVVDMLFRLLRESEWNEIERAEITQALEAFCRDYSDQTNLVYQLQDAIRIVNMPKEEDVIRLVPDVRHHENLALDLCTNETNQPKANNCGLFCLLFVPTMLQLIYLYKITMKHKHADILILGAGIAGYEAYRCLAKRLKKNNIDKTITLVDENNYFTFVPLLHEVSSGAVLPSHASFPLREVVSGSPHTFVCDRVTHIDPKKRQVTMTNETVSYDTCVVALGSISNMFNIPGSKEHAYRVRTLEQAVALKQAVVCKLEEKDRTKLNITIVGGGYTGIEVASEFAELKNREMTELYPDIDVTITIVQAGDKLVPMLPAKARNKIMKRLKQLGVNHTLNSPATKVTTDELHIGKDKPEVLPSDITIWVTGFTTKAPDYLDEEYHDRARVPVTTHLHLEHHPDTYVIGDMALIRDPDNDDIIYPQLGEAAHHEGMYVAKHIVNTINNKKNHHFHFKSRGQLMPIGEWYGIGIFGPFVFSGRFMWWLRRTVYVMFMPGFIRKLRIIADWTFISKSTRHLTRITAKE